MYNRNAVNYRIKTLLNSFTTRFKKDKYYYKFIIVRYSSTTILKINVYNRLKFPVSFNIVLIDNNTYEVTI